MNWQTSLSNLELNKQWDIAIKFMQGVIQQNPNDMEAYTALIYLIANLLTEEDYDDSKLGYYMQIGAHYFNESYKRFSENPEYLFYAGRAIAIVTWLYDDLSPHVASEMMHKALTLDPQNLIYQWCYYPLLARENPCDESVIVYAKEILNKNSCIQKMLVSKGSIGKYILDIMATWAKNIMKNAKEYEQN